MGNVYQTIAAVKADLGAIGKNKKMEAGPAKYAYRSIDDVVNALHGPMVTHGLVIVPRLESVEQTGAGETRSGTKQTRTLAQFGYRVAGPEGDYVDAETMGEAIDSGDKGTNKAGTSAYKQLLTQLFAIPFDMDDPDDHHTTVSSDRPKAAAAKPAQKAEQSPEPSGGPPAPTGSGSERKCGTCTYVIGASDPVKRKAGKYHHKICLDNAVAISEGDEGKGAATGADDISQIIDNFPGAN